VFASAEADSTASADTRTTGAYALSGLAPGIYRVTAFRDLDGDGERDPGEPSGSFLTPVEVGPGRRVDGVNFPLSVAPPEGPR